MKKIMFAAAVAAIGTAFAVESGNIVGYQDVSKGAVKQPLFGFTFTPISGASTIKLGSVTASGMEGGRDTISVINPTTLGTTAQYTYYSDAQARADAAEEAAGVAEEATGETSGAEYDAEYATAYEETYEELKELIGWWSGGLGNTSADEVVVEAGDAFLVLSPAANALTFNFKSVLDLTPIEE